MTIEQVTVIFGSTELLPYEDRPFAFREGMLMLFDLFEETDQIHSEHDQIWYGGVDDVLDRLTPEKCVYLSERGWFIDEESFSFWT